MYSNTIRIDPKQEAYIVISIVVCIGNDSLNRSNIESSALDSRLGSLRLVIGNS